MAKNKRTYDEMDLATKRESASKVNTKAQITIVKNNKEDKEKINEKLKQIVTDKYENELRTVEIKPGSELETRIQNTVKDYLNDNNIVFDPVSLKATVIKEFMLNMSGYGILQPLMDDDDVEEIYIYAPDKIWYLKDGEKRLSNIRFENKEKLKAFIDNILGRINRAVNNKNPIEDGRMPDGSRVAVSGDVLSPNGYTMNIRKFRKERITLDKLISLGSIDEKTKELLIAFIKSRVNFIVSGGTASGKTTLLNAMAQYIPANENVESIEDNIELQLNREFWLQLETRKANLEGTGKIDMEDLLVHLLRRSPDRIVVGEVRTGEVADTLMNAIQTGHDGTCTTIHANSPERCRARMCKLASVASKQPFKATCDDFNHSIQIIIQLKKLELQKKRAVTEIDFVNENNEQLIKLFEYIPSTKNEPEQFKHYELPKELLNRFEEYDVHYEAE